MTTNVVETHTIRRSLDHDHKHPGVNQYVFGIPLGEGMHGKVVQARDTVNNQAVAIKIMKRSDPHNRKLPKSLRPDVPPPTAQEETEAKIRKEIAVMKKCTHPNVVRLLEVIDDPASKKVYLVMENLEGGEVKWRVRNRDDEVGEPVLALNQIQRILRDVTLGLEYLHHQGIIHRDIKPANLLWTANCQSVKICDFGVSHFIATTNDPLLCDEAGLSKTAGSPAFFAPELCTIPDFSFDERSSSTNIATFIPQPITKQIDIWALGVTFYCLLFGKVPWEGHSEFVMFKAICTEDFKVPRTMARDRIPTGGRERWPEGKEVGWIVVDLLSRLLAKDQFKRITLAEIKQIPWVLNGAPQDDDNWTRETTQNIDSRVVVTEEEARTAIKRAWYSYPGFVARIASTIKRVPATLSGRSSGSTRGPSTPVSNVSGSSHLPEQAASSSCYAPSCRPRNRLKRFTFGAGVSPSRGSSVTNDSDVDLSSTTTSSILWRRNSSAGLLENPQFPSSPPLPGSSTSTPDHRMHISWSKRRQSDSLHAPKRSIFHGTSASSTSSPTTPDEQPSLTSRLSRAVRSNSVRKAVKGIRDRKGDDEKEPNGRASAEKLHASRPKTGTEELDVGLSHSRRVSSWGSPTPQLDIENFDSTGSDVVGSGSVRVIQDFNKSVVKFGAGGYVDAPGPSVSDFDCTCDKRNGTTNPNVNGVAASSSQMVEMTSSDSSDSTTRQPDVESSLHPPRVRSPLARSFGSASASDDGISSDVFDDAGTDEQEDDSSEDEVLELRTRRPSAVLYRPARVPPIR